MHVLVIEDSRVMRKIIAELLREFGFSVLEAEDGRQGLELLRKDIRPSLILLDWHMPVLDGIGFLAEMRAEHSYSDIPVMMITTQADRLHVAQALKAGANEYLMKPFTKEMLDEKLAILGIKVA